MTCQDKRTHTRARDTADQMMVTWLSQLMLTLSSRTNGSPAAVTDPTVIQNAFLRAVF